jgi:hypothetical protein
MTVAGLQKRHDSQVQEGKEKTTKVRAGARIFADGGAFIRWPSIKKAGHGPVACAGDANRHHFSTAPAPSPLIESSERPRLMRARLKFRACSNLDECTINQHL